MNQFSGMVDLTQVNKYLHLFDELFTHIGIERQFLIYVVDSIAMNDQAHNLGHVYGVTKLAGEICDKLDLGFRNKKIAMVAALLHDIGCRLEREYHHLIGYGLSYEILHNYWRGEFSDNETMLIAKAVLEHRSSSKHKPTSKISEVVSVADSGVPCINTYIKRCMQYRLSRGDHSFGTDPGKFFNDVKEHLKEKFGTNGYHWVSYPDLGMDFFHREWKEFCDYLEEENDAKFSHLLEVQYNALRG